MLRDMRRANIIVWAGDLREAKNWARENGLPGEGVVFVKDGVVTKWHYADRWQDFRGIPRTGDPHSSWSLERVGTYRERRDYADASAFFATRGFNMDEARRG